QRPVRRPAAARWGVPPGSVAGWPGVAGSRPLNPRGPPSAAGRRAMAAPRPPVAPVSKMILLLIFMANLLSASSGGLADKFRHRQGAEDIAVQGEEYFCAVHDQLLVA